MIRTRIFVSLAAATAHCGGVSPCWVTPIRCHPICPGPMCTPRKGSTFRKPWEFSAQLDLRSDKTYSFTLDKTIEGKKRSDRDQRRHLCRFGRPRAHERPEWRESIREGRPQAADQGRLPDRGSRLDRRAVPQRGGRAERRLRQAGCAASVTRSSRQGRVDLQNEIAAARGLRHRARHAVHRRRRDRRAARCARSSTGRSTRASTSSCPCGSTGEAATMTLDEHRRVVEITVEQARGRVPVVAGAGSTTPGRRSRCRAR